MSIFFRYRLRCALVIVVVSCLESRFMEAFQALSSIHRIRIESPAASWLLRQQPEHTTTSRPRTSVLLAALPGGPSNREMEIRRKIAKLKQEGRLRKKSAGDELFDDDDDRAADVYQDKIRQKLGDAKSRMLGFTGGRNENADENADEDDEDQDEDIVLPGESQQSNAPQQQRRAQIGSLPTIEEVYETTAVDEGSSSSISSSASKPRKPIIDPSLFDDGEDREPDLSEEDLVDLVAQKLMEKNDRERQENDTLTKQKALADIEEERKLLEKKQHELLQQSVSARPEVDSSSSTSETKQTTTGIGGSWSKDTAAEEFYQPKSGSWGAFPRPKDISKAYGGGRRVGPGFSNEEARQKSQDDTRARLQQYREKMGIDVQSEKENAEVIEEALKIGMLAMQRGMYSTAVSALEKVTKFCSSNSKVGGKVYLELAMAYEAAGKTSEAITVYSALSNSRIEEIKFDAKRLLYGLEAMQFMRNEVKASSFDRQKIKNTFIETTGLANIASNFDNVYQTAYIDLEGNTYKKLTESVVRSVREARQILLKATGAGEVGRMRVVQALRSLGRRFDDALANEITVTQEQETVAVLNGKPIMSSTQEIKPQFGLASSGDEFVLADAQSMRENLDGEWRLQLLADKRGDGVKYFNSTVSWQHVDMDTMTFSSAGPAGFVTVQQSGKIVFNEKRRILRRSSVEESGGGVFTGIFGGKTSGATGAVSTPQQIMTVDSVLMVTRGVPNKRSRGVDDEKDYFAVWRRVDPGTYCRAPAAKRTAMTTSQKQ